MTSALTGFFIDTLLMSVLVYFIYAAFFVPIGFMPVNFIVAMALVTLIRVLRNEERKGAVRSYFRSHYRAGKKHPDDTLR